jgi:hypothetical protein
MGALARLRRATTIELGWGLACKRLSTATDQVVPDLIALKRGQMIGGELAWLHSSRRSSWRALHGKNHRAENQKQKAAAGNRGGFVAAFMKR